MKKIKKTVFNWCSADSYPVVFVNSLEPAGTPPQNLQSNKSDR